MGIIRSYIKQESEAELSFSKYRILSRVSKGICSVSDLAELTCVSSPAASKLVDTLVNDKYLTREVCDRDRRITHLKITQKGKKKFEKVQAGASLHFLEKLEHLSSSEVKKLMSALSTLDNFVQNLQESNS